jgi:nifR3 family TIM-barrel protein
MFKIGDIEFGDFPLFLAPMEDVTDPTFRTICKDMGADMLYTEFISSEGLIRDAAKSTKKLFFEEIERPIGIQIFGHIKESLIEAAQIAEKVRPNLIDINWGCPVKKVVQKEAGSGILKDIPKMIALSKAIVEAVDLPVTAKTRLGWDDSDKPILEIALRLQDAGVKALSIHGRTRNQLYKGEADWTLIGEVANHPDIEIPIIGNGDIYSPQRAIEYKNKYGVDALMIGRAAIGNPWIFRDIKHFQKTGEILPPPNTEERVRVCLKHLHRSIEWKGERRGLLEMRRHYSTYFKGFPAIKDFRLRLVTEDLVENIEKIMIEITEKYNDFKIEDFPNRYEKSTVSCGK